MVLRVVNGHLPVDIDSKSTRTLKRLPDLANVTVVRHAVLCQESASGARAFARVLRGFERNDRFAEGTAMRGLPSPRRKAGNGPNLVKSWRWSALGARKLPALKHLRPYRGDFFIASCLTKMIRLRPC
jgi:hypothetical protein